MKKIFILALFVLLICGIVGCAGLGDTKDVDEANTSFKYLGSVGGYGAHRLVDYEAQVVCYRFHNAGSCLPLSDTALPRE